MKLNKNLLVAIYSHPEYYPPTLNALDMLAATYDQVTVVHRNIIGFDWKYPANVKLVSYSKPISPARAAALPLYAKIYWFFVFTRCLLREARKIKAHTVLFYDCFPILSYRLIRGFICPPQKLWYHNHDVTELKYIRRFSLNWWAWKSERWIFPRLDLFTLPSDERKVCFPMEKLKSAYLCIPNYPSASRFETIVEKPQLSWKILFQGSIGPDHSIEEIISLLPGKINGRPLELILKGFVSTSYLSQVFELAKKSGVDKQIHYIGPSGYQEVIDNANICHIGLAIYLKSDVMNNTLGTASNKIYEYAAAGLPVLLNCSETFLRNPGRRKWVFFSKGTGNELKSNLEEICADYDNLSREARHDIEVNFDFSIAFMKVFHYLN